MNSYTPVSLYTDLKVAFGVWSGLTPPTAYSDYINFELCEITPPKQEIERLISRMSHNAGVALDSQAKPSEEPAQVKLTASTLSPKLLAIALGATVADVSQTTGAIVDEAITTVLNAWVPAKNAGIAAHGTGTEILLETSGDVEVVSTKYAVDLEAGLLMALHADAVGSMKFSYHKAARTWETYSSGAAIAEYVHITGTARERRTGYLAPFDIWRTQLSSSSAFDPAKGTYLKPELTGDLLLPTVAIERVGGALVIPTAAWSFRLRTA